MRILFIIFVIGLFPLSNQACAEGEDFKRDLVALSQSIKDAEVNRNEIDKQLVMLQSEFDILNKKNTVDRYQATKSLYDYYNLQNSSQKYRFLLKNSSLLDGYFNERYNHSTLTILKSKIVAQNEQLSIINDKRQSIENYIRDRDLLSKTIQASLEQLSELQSVNKPRNLDQFKDIIDDLKAKNKNLDSFVKDLLNLDMATIKREEQSSPLSFILPVSGIINNRIDHIEIISAPESSVVSPERGDVIFADNFGKLGNIIIINHGQGYVSVLRGLGTLYSTVSFTVAKGEIIALLEKGENINKNSKAPMLNYELRYNDSLINPLTKLTGL